MNKNYIILAHKNPLQLKKMIEQLDDKLSFFYIHIDLKSDISAFKKNISLPNVHFIEKRENCLWGDFSIVKATINLMCQVKKDAKKGFVILMSGQDYPIKNNDEINDFFTKNPNTDFIEIVPIEQKWKKKMAQDKIAHYHILHSEERGDSNCYAPFFHSSLKQKLRTLFHLLKGKLSYKNFKKIKTFPKRIPLFEKQYAGSQFWAFSEKTFHKIVQYIDENEGNLEKYYQFSSSSDEIYFQSILMFLAEKDENITIKPSLTYVNWHRKNCQLPVTFVQEDLAELLVAKEKYLFARKFDTELDEKILNLLEKHSKNDSKPTS